jgi:hypothetical protein
MLVPALTLTPPEQTFGVVEVVPKRTEHPVLEEKKGPQVLVAYPEKRTLPVVIYVLLIA